MTATQSTPQPATPMRWIAHGLIFGAAVLPYIGGFPLAYLLMLLVVVLGIWQLVTARHEGFVIEPAAALFALAYALLLIVFAVNARDLVDLGSALNFLLLLFFHPLVLALRRFSRMDAARLLALAASLGVSVAILVALFQRAVHFTLRSTGYLSDSLWATTAVIALGFIALVGARASAFPRHRLFLLAPVGALVVTILAGARGPLLAFGPLLVVAALLLPRRRWISMALLAGGAAVVALVFFAVQTFMPATAARLWTIVDFFQQVREGDDLSDRSMSIRWSLLEGALEAFRTSPWLGHGWGHFGEVIEPYVGRFDLAPTAGQFHLHSDLADFAVAGGVAGILAYGLILLAPVVGALASPRDSQRGERIIGTAMLSVTYLVCGQTNALFGFEFLTTLYVVLAAILLGWCRDPAPGTAPPA